MASKNDLLHQQRAINDLVESDGWKMVLLPALQKRIADLEASLVATGDKELDKPATRQARRDRQLLQTLTKDPQHLIDDLTAAVKARP